MMERKLSSRFACFPPGAQKYQRENGILKRERTEHRACAVTLWCVRLQRRHKHRKYRVN